MVSYNEVYGALVTAEAKPASIATGEKPDQPLVYAGVAGQEVIGVWYYTDGEGAEAWTVEVYGPTAERVNELEQWVMSRLRDELGEAMSWDEEGEPVAWPDTVEPATPTAFGAVMFGN